LPTSFQSFPPSSAQAIPPSSPPAEILLADELTLVREGLAILLNSLGGFRVVAQVETGTAALAEIVRLKPSIALLDDSLTDVVVIETLRKVRKLGLPTRCAILSVRKDRCAVHTALREGASGYLLKTASQQQLVEALTTIRNGGIYVAPQIEMNSLLTYRTKSSSGNDPLEALSVREFQVFSQLIEGVRPKEIAARLSLSPKTVDTYRSGLMRKLDIHHVAGLVRFSVQRDSTATALVGS
jgi:DNA-binding NarL/FixJ family response regulator